MGGRSKVSPRAAMWLALCAGAAAGCSFGDGDVAPAALVALGFPVLPRRSRAPELRAAFETLHGAADAPAALTDVGGRVLAANAAMAPPETLEGEVLICDLLARWSGDPEALVYRVASVARRDGEACERTLVGDEAWELRARRLRDERLLWTVERAPRTSTLPEFCEGAPFACMTIAPNRPPIGNAAAGALPAPARRALADRAVAGRLEEWTELDLPDGEAGSRRARARAAVWEDQLQVIAQLLPPDASSAASDYVEALPVALVRLAPDGVVISANAAARALLGPRIRPGAAFAGLIEGFGRSIDARIAEALRGDSTGRSEIAHGEVEGREVFLQVSLTRVEVDGAPSLVAVLADATELKTLEAHFVQSQKMQAVGQLAGGVAHDFNNLLTAIMGHADLLLHRHDRGDADYADLIQIRQNANRAAGLVRQLLAFSRKQTLRPKVIDLTDALGELRHLLNRLLGGRVSLKVDVAAGLHLVKVDERQFEQVIVNLAVNARDAMPEGGAVTLRAANARIGAEKRRGRAVMPKGDYVRIDVLDQGTGVPPDKIEQIFEPFYTTKKVGEGTGLGLSTVYGIVKQTGGFIFAENVPAGGAMFSVFLPRHEGEAEPAQRAAAASVADLTGSGAVLLVEDEAPVRAFAKRALKLRGYEVVEAASAEEALDLLADPELEIDVIVSDVVMPGMDGPTCVREARRTRPGLRAIFVSGYAEDALRKSIGGIEDCQFLPKPFSLNELTQKVKEAVTG